MNRFLKLILVFLLTLCTTLSASEKETKNIAKISAASLYNIDKNSLEKTINAYIQTHPDLKALKIVEILSGETFYQMYRSNGNIYLDKEIPENIQKFRKFTSKSKYETEIVGTATAYFKDDSLIKLTQEEQEFINKHPNLSVGFSSQREPLMIKNAESFTGILPEYFELLSQNTGLNFKFIDKKWGEVLKLAGENNFDIVANLDQNIAENLGLLTSQSPFKFLQIAFAKKDRDFEINSIDDLKGKRVSYFKNAKFIDNYLKKRKDEIKLVPADSPLDAIFNVLQGKADVVIGTNINGYLFIKHSITSLEPTYIFKDNTTQGVMGINSKYPELVSILNKAMAAIPLTQTNKILNKWSLIDEEKTSNIKLTKKEQIFLTSHKNIILGADQNWQPFDFKNRFGKHDGFDADLLKLIGKKLGIDIQVELGPWGELQQLVKDKKIAGLVGPAKTASREKYMEFTEPYFFISQVILQRKNAPILTSIDQLSNKTLALKSGSSNIEHFKEKYPKIKQKIYNTYADIIRAVSLGEVDAGLSNIGAASYEMERNFISNIKVGFELNDLMSDMRFGIRKDWPELASILQKGIDAISEKEFDTLLNKWLKLAAKQSEEKKVLFTKEEKEYLDYNPTIRLAYMNFWPTDDNGLNIHTEYVNLLSKYGNININLVKYDAWKDGFKSAEKGINIHGILNLSWSLERAKNSFNYTKPYYYTPSYLVVKKENHKIKSLKDLINKPIYSAKNSITTKLINDLQYNMTPIVLDSESKIYEALSKDNSEAEALLTYNLTDDLETYKLKVVEKSYSKYGEVHIGVSKNHKELHSIINKIYDAIPKNELTKIQNKKYKKTKKTKVLLTQKEKEYIKNKPVIKVHNEKNWPPFNFHEFGQPKGYSVELIKLVAKNTGLNIEFITGPTWDEFLGMMKNDQLDIITNIVKNEEREKYMLFTDPFMKATMGIAVHKNDPKITKFDDILKKKVALENGFFYHDYFKKNHPDTTLHVVDNSLQTLQSVAFKNADATIGFIPVMKYIAQKNFINDLKFIVDTNSPIMQPIPLRFSTSKSSPELQSILQKGLASITPDQYRELSQKWLHQESTKEKLNISLTKEEKEWLKQHKEITFTADPNYLPYEAFSDEGDYYGMVSDYLDIIESTLDIKFVKVPVETWSEALEKAKNNKVSVLSNYSNDEALKDEHISTHPYIKSPVAIITRKDHKKVNALKDLRKEKIAVIKGYGYLNEIFKKHPNLNYIEVENAITGLKGVSSGEFDAILCSQTLATYTIADLGLHNLKTAGQTDTIMELGLGVRKDWAIFVKILDKVIDAIPNGEKQKINQRWIVEDSINKIILTKKEKEWIKKQQVIKYVFDPDWAPFEWKNELGQHTGIIYDILTLVKERTDLNLQQIPTNSWNEAVVLAEQKQVDMYGGLGETSERKEYMNFTQNTLYKAPYVFVVRKENKNDYFDTFNSFKGDEKIAVVDGYTIEGILQDKQPELQFDTVLSTMDGFKALSRGKIDVFIVNAATARYYINRKGFDDLKIATKTKYQLEIKAAIRKDWPPEVISILDKGLKSISEKELSDIYQKWTVVQVEQEIDWSIVYKVAGGAIVLILLIGYWNRQLKQTVEEKTTEVTKLLHSFDENVIALRADLDGNITYVSQALCKMSGYRSSELLGNSHAVLKDPATSEEFLENLLKTIKEEKVWKGESRNQNKAGEYYWVYGVVTPEYDSNNKLVGYSDIKHDISAQKDVEKLSDELTHLVDSFDENVIALKADLNGKITYVSQALCKMSGYSNEELLGNSHTILKDPASSDEFLKNLLSTIKEEKTWQGESRNRSKAGEYYWVYGIVTPEYDNEHNLIGYSDIKHDISAQKDVEKLSGELQKTLENFDENVIASRSDLKGNITYASKAFAKISGYTVDELMGKPHSTVRHPDMPKEFFKELWETIQSGKVWKGEVKNIKKDGSFYWVEAVITPEFDENDNITAYSAIRHDITAKKEVEELSETLEHKVEERTSELKESQEQFSSMAANVPGVIYRCKVDAGWTMLFISDEIVKLSGYPVNDFINNSVRSFADIMNPKDIERVANLIKSQIDKGEKFLVDYRVISKDGEERWVRNQGQSIIVNNELCIDGVLFDFTEQRALEEIIKQNTEQMTYVSQNANLGFWNFNPQIGDLYVNNVFVEMLGYEADNVLIDGYEHEMFKPFKDGLAFWEQLLHPEDAIRTGEILTAHINGETDLYNVEYRMRRADGSWMWSRAVGRISKFDEDGKPIKFDGVNIDIDDAKRAQEELDDQKQYINSILDSQDNIVIATDGEQLRSANSAFLDFFSVKDKEEFMEKFGACICDTFDIDTSGEFIQKETEGQKWIEYVFDHNSQINKVKITLNKKSHIFTITADKFTFQDEELMVAVFTDITELEEVRRNIELILSNIMLPVLITSKEDRRILYANEYAATQYETTVANLVDSSIDNVYTSEIQKDEIRQIIDDIGYVENLEEKYKTQKGKEFSALLSVKPITYNSEDAYIGMVVDITKQKEIEEEIRQIHKHTQSSIEYASLIQHSLIPSNDLFRKYFSDYLTIWHPKDIVGGDIYLFDELRDDNECLLMVIDCTGHGVPGAFVTMLVKAIERQVAAIIASDPTKEVSPAWILSYFNKTMKHLLKQESDESISNAGFDGGVLYFNKKENIIKFAGAEVPLFYKDPDETEYKIIKGDRHSIGYKKSNSEFEFKDHTIIPKEGMQFYLTTDGYLDQNGGEKGFPLGKKRFRSMIEEYAHEPFADQQEVLLDTLMEYQGNEERNDDVTLVGIKIGKLEANTKQNNVSWSI